MDYAWLFSHTLDGVTIPGTQIAGTETDIAVVRLDDIVIPNLAADFPVPLAAVILAKWKAFSLIGSAYHATLFTVKFGSAVNPAIPIIDAMVFGPGNISMMDNAPTTLYFGNTTGAAITIQSVGIVDPT